MKRPLQEFTNLSAGLYLQPDPMPDTFYLQGVHFNESGQLLPQVRPQVLAGPKIAKHLLLDGDVLFAAKGLNNFAVVFRHADMGSKAVASSSFIVLRSKDKDQTAVTPDFLAWYLTHSPEVKAFRKQLGTTIPSISISALSTLEVPIPDMATQERIIAIQELRYREKILVQTIEAKKDYLIKQQLLKSAHQ